MAVGNAVDDFNAISSRMSHIQARGSGRLAPIDIGVVEARFLDRRDGNKTYSCQRHVTFPRLAISRKEFLNIGNPLTSFLYRPLTTAILASACPVDDLIGSLCRLHICWLQ